MEKQEILQRLDLPDCEQEDILAALATEMPNQLDSRMFSSVRAITMVSRAAVLHFAKYTNTGAIVLAAQHPLATVIIGSIAAFQLGTGGFLKYNDYSKDFDDTLLALGFLTHAPPEAIKQLNMSVAGALEYFLKGQVISVFSERVTALKQVYATEPENVDVAERLRIYTAGLAQSAKLQTELLSILRDRERERDDHLKKKGASLENSLRSLQQLRDALEVRYKAGLISHDIYSDGKSELLSQSIKLKTLKFANSAAGFTKMELASVAQNYDLADFYRDICKPQVSATLEQTQQLERQNQQSLWLIIAIVVSVFFLVYFGNQVLLG